MIQEVRQRGAPVLFLGLLAGTAGFSILFSDPSRGEGPIARVLMAMLLSGLAGLLVGFIQIKGWIFAATLSAWGSVVLGLAGLAMEQSLAVGMIVLPLSFALAAGLVGSQIGRLRVERERRGDR